MSERQEDYDRLITHTVRAQAIVEAVEEYEEAHTPGSPCFSEALALMKAVCEP